MSKELNIKSSTIEKGFDLVKDFVGKLIGPTIEEVGLLFSDKIKYYRFKNQVNILIKAKAYVQKKDINLKEIPTKILVPLLENASLEDNSEMQDKWANMIGNLADSEQNLQNQIFPYLLSQVSKEEYDCLLQLSSEEIMFQNKVERYQILVNNSETYSSEGIKLNKEINEIQQTGFWLKLEGYEVANIQRLGLIKQLPPKILIDGFSTGGHLSPPHEWHQLEAEYDNEDFGHRITDLGKKFIETCEAKKPVGNNG